MCAERIQRFLMAIVLTVAMVLFAKGLMLYALIIQTFVIAMVVIWALTDFCPSIWMFRKIFGSCEKK
ncbi:MAG: phosphoribosylaminoimidazole synthetase [Sulfuricurvum sp.]|jgi:hypothetical protein|uniref:phosphoribosylaminoimidazole synthetase n=3 Tax=Sulfuricurvum TaxID=286130 RepID=UPI002621B277|nr:phosphoribosylaminoimidazole synthetase [Sulfuricurvum sp.]MDD2838476.1 phosphoribosylaminoimidazole synthetase [Sulfuricurvum sp.]MDD3595401.1 phosphoribosylaminoimidazole synthetase [Sulfuricurvum sp.]